MADICEKDSEERVWRVLGLTVAEIRHRLDCIMRPEKDTVMTDDLAKPEEWRFGFLLPLPPASVDFLREKIHETLVASAMAERTEVIIPAASPIWRERAVTALAEIRSLAATARPPFARVRRPVWPG